MSLRQMKPEFFRSIAFRLTLWYAGIFSVSSCVAFGLFYFLVTQTIQAQVDQELVDKAGYFKTIIQRNGIVGAQNLAVIEAQAAGEKLIFFRLLYRNGEVFASSHMSYWQGVGIDTKAVDELMHSRSPVFQTTSVDAHNKKSQMDTNRTHKARILYSFVASNVILQTGIAMEAHSKFISAFNRVFGFSMGFIVLFSAVGGLFLARKALSGVKAITRTANTISGSNLEKRVPETGSKDELDLLANTFNQMLDRISTLVKSIREMSDNIAHDLKSPLTRIRGFAEIALVHGDDEDIDSYKAMASNTIEESDRLLDMINTMLVISRAEAGESDFEFAPMDLGTMIDEACDLFVPCAEDKNIAFTHQVVRNICVDADARMLQRAFSNMIDNALKYTPETGRVHVIMKIEPHNMVCVQVSDTGPGIDPGSHKKIFERFFRAESSRTSPGTGLGLSLAQSIIRQHQGDLLVDSQPGSGAVFTMRLPYRNF